MTNDRLVTTLDGPLGWTRLRPGAALPSDEPEVGQAAETPRFRSIMKLPATPAGEMMRLCVFRHGG
jgi:hypothetical protein